MQLTYNDIDVNAIIEIARNAGEAIMEVYAREFDVEVKDDKSPLTEADKKSNSVILDGLKAATPTIPYISEETRQTPYDERKNWQRFWLIDPLDGTKEFIKRNGEFTVNIALIEEGIPVIGVVYAPAKDMMYVGVKGMGSFKIQDDLFIMLKAGVNYRSKPRVVVVASRSHLTSETVSFVQNLKNNNIEVDFLSSGSSLKFCMVADGKADVYPRFGPTMEWDTGAAHAVALYAGKNVINYDTARPLEYNKENMLNPWFIVE